MIQLAYFFFGGRGLLRLFQRRLVQRLGAWLTLLGFLPLATGGCNYYRTKPQATASLALSKLAETKFFLVHEGTQTWQLTSPHLEGETLVGTKAPVLDTQLPYINPDPRATNRRFRHRDSRLVLNLVHLYLGPATQPAPDGPVRVPVSSIQRAEVVDEDTGRTLANHLGVAAGITVGTLALLLVVVALTKSSCPFVYASDGQSYRFVGEAYGGAIFAPAERHDYMPLPAIAPVGGEYQVKISNELKERQYTNLAELWVVQHPVGSQVLLDSLGRVHTLRHPQAPLSALSEAGTDYTARLQARDHAAVLFDEATPGPAPTRLTMRFARPLGAQRGKLVLRAQNSLWLDFLYGKFIEQFGGLYNTWAARQHNLPAGTNARWAQEQHIPLKVYCKTAQGWQLAGSVPTVGPLAAREVVVPVEFGPGRGPVRLRLETGFMFWEVDYAALDCTPDEVVQAVNCELRSARNQAGADERAALAADDAAYLRQLRPGTEVRLRYQAHLPAHLAGTQRTVFLHTKGYYEHIRDFKGLPDVLALNAFRQPGHFAAFSKELYRHYAPPAPALASAQP